MMADNLVKKRRIDENLQLSECCICGETGTLGYTNTFQISLREKDYSINFNELIFFTVGINVQKESSYICQVCKPKIIEFFHLKKKSQSLQTTFSPLLQEIMKIVGNYVSKKSIKAVTIEESNEKLVIMEKIHTVENPSSLKIAEVSSICDVQIKKEADSSDLNDTIDPNIEIKKEPMELQEIYDLPMPSIIPFENINSTTTIPPDNKLDTILSLNKEILDIVRTIKHLSESNILNSNE